MILNNINKLACASAIVLCSLSINTLANSEQQDFYIKLGSFANKANAQRLSHTLQQQHQANVALKQYDDYTVVELGPYSSKAAAKEVIKKNKYAHKGIIYAHATNHSHAESQASSPPILTTESQNQPAPPAAPPAVNTKKSKPTTKLWNLRQANIRSVIEAVSQSTGKNFLIDPRVQGKVSIVSSKAITSEELYQVFLSMLQVSGYAAIPTGKVIKIIPNIDARSTGGDDDLAEQYAKGDEMIVQVVPVEYVSAEQLVPVIRPLMPQWSNVSAYSPSNTLILSGRADNIQRLAGIIKQVDTSSSNGIDAITLRYALAMDVVSTLKALTDTQKNRVYQRSATIAADDKSNTILVSGSKTERLRIRLLINQLDTKSASNIGNTAVIYLKYMKAQDILPILSGVAKANFSGSVGTTVGTITETPLDTSTPGSAGSTDGSSDSSSYNGYGNTAGQTSTANNSAIAANTQASSDSSEGNSKPKVQIIADPNTNAIILSAPQTLLRTLKSIIAKLDMRPAQVLVEALITEINDSDINNLGLEWGMIAPSTDGNNNTSLQFSNGFAIIRSGISLNDFQARLTALVTTNRANILSTPSVVVLDNRQAKILVGRQISIQDSSYPGNANGVGQTNPFNTFTRQNVALHLYVRPQISQGGNIQMQIDHGNDSLPTDSGAANAVSGRPVVNTSSIQTSVIVNTGDVLVLGGLVQHERRQSGEKIPILGDLPGIGRAFQNNSHSKDKKVLMVFIRPIILQDEKTSLQVTGSKYFDLRSQQQNWMKNYKPYDPDNKNMIYKPLDQTAKLPTPFAQRQTKRS